MIRKPPREVQYLLFRYWRSLSEPERLKIVARAGRRSGELLTNAEHLAKHKTGRPFKVAADPEIRAFTDARLGTMSFAALADAVREHFGRERAPSKGGIHRYWLALPTAYRDRIVARAAKASRSKSPQ